MDGRPAIRFDRVTKVFESENNRVLAIQEASFSVRENEFTSIVGPSGCGKTTLLRMCAGLTFPTSGAVRYRDWSVNRVNNRIGYVTQDSNLYPWLTLIENVEFPLAVRGIPKEERRRKAAEFLEMFGLTGFERAYPRQLSGGMQKRASIIRTLIYDPEVVLMDEPFGPLDAQTRLVLQNELQQIWQQTHKTVLFITHDLVEAIALSDTVVLMTKRPGRVKGIFPIPLERPRNVFNIHEDPSFPDLYRGIWDRFRSEVVDGAKAGREREG
ncbi:MAG: ABC transporter ATP-binding protein [Candidatus Tectomicrobia bacterium]|nr:ABC transporter ATP-binding protein [Candidatus Tectomicrobia bacterium]